jgi:hypothetical protein
MEMTAIMEIANGNPTLCGHLGRVSRLLKQVEFEIYQFRL